LGNGTCARKRFDASAPAASINVRRDTITSPR
jgi:hypothetical protein